MTVGVGSPEPLDEICICGHARKWHLGPSYLGRCHSGISPCQGNCSSFIKTTLERQLARERAFDDAIAAVQARIDELYEVKETTKEGRARLGLTEARELLKKLARWGR